MAKLDTKQDPKQDLKAAEKKPPKRSYNTTAQRQTKVQTLNVQTQGQCNYPTLQISPSTACGRELFYPENDFALALLSTLTNKRNAYTREQLKSLKSIGFVIDVIHKPIDMEF